MTNDVLLDPHAAPEPMRRADLIAALRAVNPFTSTALVMPQSVADVVLPIYEQLQRAHVSRQARRAGWKRWREQIEHVCRRIESGDLVC